MMLTLLRSSSLAMGAVGLLFLSNAVYADEPTPNQNTAVQTVKQGKKWETDAVLQRGMHTIRQAMAANQAGIKMIALARVTINNWLQLCTQTSPIL